MEEYMKMLNEWIFYYNNTETGTLLSNFRMFESQQEIIGEQAIKQWGLQNVDFAYEGTYTFICLHKLC